MTAVTLLERLDKVKATAPDRWLARCPTHDDRSPSLSIRVVDDRLLVHCFAGCQPLDIVHAVGLELADLFEDSRCGAGGKHAHKPTHRRIAARDILEALDHEAHVVAVIASDVHQKRVIDNATWDRLALAVSRIGNARAMR